VKATVPAWITAISTLVMAAILVYAVIVGYRMLNALSESFGQFGQEPTSMHTATPGCDPNIEMC
jgi:negative regulator of sigma E activity